jgi:SAM-dependent methyltransferase
MRAGHRGAIPLCAAERRLSVRLRHAVGVRQTYEVDGVRYRELSTERLKHALSKKGRGFKEFDVVFRGGAPMRISATPRRVFADVSGPRLLGVYQRVEPVLRPGMRALLLSSGTGYAGEWVASRVAPSGAVVALDEDQQSIAYAQRRYPVANVSFEVGGIEALSGETDGAFDAVMAVGAIGEGQDPETVLRELWRVVAPAGWLMAACPARGGARDSAGAACIPGDRLMEQVTEVAGARDSAHPTPAPTVSAIGDERDGWAVVVALKPIEERG